MQRVSSPKVGRAEAPRPGISPNRARQGESHAASGQAPNEFARIYPRSAKQTERLVIKVGTRVLTREDQHLDYNAIHQIVRQIGELRRAGHEIVLVSSGAAGASWGLADFSLQRDPHLRLQMMAAVGQPRLMQIYADFCREEQIPIAQALLTRQDFSHRTRYLSIRSALEGLLRLGVLCIVNENDLVTAEAPVFGDNDYLSAAVAAAIGAERLFLLTTADGFHAVGDPHTHVDSRPLAEVREITPEMWRACGPPSGLGRGGMEAKLHAAEMVNSFGIVAHIVPGKVKGIISRVLAGESHGTTFLAPAKQMKSFRRWLRFGALPNGRIFVDAGAAQALLTGKSLLPAGILRIEGDFQKGAVVDICDAESHRLGLGVSDWSTQELQLHIKSLETDRSSAQILSGAKQPSAQYSSTAKQGAAQLSQTGARQVVHRDRLVLWNDHTE